MGYHHSFFIELHILFIQEEDHKMCSCHTLERKSSSEKCVTHFLAEKSSSLGDLEQA